MSDPKSPSTPLHSRAEDIKPLTSLRFLAALWVLSYSFIPAMLPAAHNVPAIFNYGNLGVELFFILSGFILTHVYFEDYAKGHFPYKKYLVARLARVYPVHIFCMVLMLTLYAAARMAGVNVLEESINFHVLWQNLTMTHAWGFAHQVAWNTPSWSISAEWLAYILFPAFAFVGMKMRAWPLAFAALAALLVGVVQTLWRLAFEHELSDQSIFFGLVRIIPCFLYGMALWMVWRANRITHKHFAPIAGILAVMAMVWLAPISTAWSR